jgi:hypothetical protein
VAEHGSSDSIYEGLSLLLSSPDTVARIVASGQALVREQYHFGLKMSKLEALYRACID